MSERIDTLFIVGHGKENGEKATIPFVLANIEARDNPDKKVEVIMMFEAAELAVQGKAEGFEIGAPFDSMDLAARMKSFQEKGGVINVCMPCLALRSMQNEPILEGIQRIKGPDLLKKKDLATKLMPFT